MDSFSLDIDGVVADYHRGIRETVQHLGIRPMSQPVGLDPEQLDALMQERRAAITKALQDYLSMRGEEFLSGLACMVRDDDRRAIRRAIAEGYELFWTSSRGHMGYHITEQNDWIAEATLDWFQRNDLPCDPAHLLLTRDKAGALTGHGIKHHLDDHVPHATSIALRSKAEVYLIRRPWNRHIVIRHQEDNGVDYETRAASFGLPEVDSIAEYIMLITGR